jgi:hypothetical protein
MFLVLRGRVSLDFGVDDSSPLNKTYGPGALIGLPATLTGRTYRERLQHDSHCYR